MENTNQQRIYADIIGLFNFINFKFNKQKFWNRKNAISNDGFSYSTIKDIEIPEGINFIDHNAFAYCKQLSKVTLPKSLDIMEKEAFLNCTKLDEITLPDNLYYVGPRCFKGCAGLKKINIPSSIKIINNDILDGCTNLEELQLDEGIESIDGTFTGNCPNLLSITLPDSIEKIAERTFASSKIETINWPEKCTLIDSETFIDCKNLKNIKFSKSLKNIWNNAFYNCSSLENLDLSQTNLQLIASSAFQDCLKVKTILFPDTLKYINENAFKNCFSLDTVVAPINCFVQKNSFDNCEFQYVIYTDNQIILTNDKDSIPADLKITKIIDLDSYKRIYSDFDYSQFFNDGNYNPSKITAFEEITNYLTKQKAHFSMRFFNTLFSQDKKDEFTKNTGNFKFMNQVFKKLVGSQKLSSKTQVNDISNFVKLAYNLGCFSKDDKIAQKSSEFLKSVLDRDILKINDCNYLFEKMMIDDSKIDFINFITNKDNFGKIINICKNNEGGNIAFFSNLFNRFEEIQAANTSHKGSQRQLFPTVEKFFDYFNSNKFGDLDEKLKPLAMEIGKFSSERNEFKNASFVFREFERNCTPKNILSAHLASSIPYGDSKEPRKKIKLETKTFLGKTKNNSPTLNYDFMEKDNVINYTLGKYCECCAHFAGAGYGIMRASIVLPDVQNLVILDKHNNILAKSTLYINKDEQYGVYNNVEVAINHLDESSYSKFQWSNLIFKMFMQATEDFAEIYNKENPNKPLKQINVGMGHNDLLCGIDSSCKKSDKILEGVHFNRYCFGPFDYPGDWSESQYIVWQNEKLLEKPESNNTNKEKVKFGRCL